MKHYFEGWYFKHQRQGNTLCLIPGRAEEEAFIQVITNEKSYQIPFPLSKYQKLTGEQGIVSIGSNRFSKDGVEMAIDHGKLQLKGKIEYSELTPLKYDIMGPFALLPMQTKHSVVSMNHHLKGAFILNGAELSFDGGKGYIEGDRGHSFPSSYAWVQCNDLPNDCSIMLSIAKIPFGLFSFWGVIGIVWLNKKEYRLATYKGVHIVQRSKEKLEVKQGKYRLVIDIAPQLGHKLAAPEEGEMIRTIHESVSTAARFRFYEKEILLLDEKSENVGAEYVE